MKKFLASVAGTFSPMIALAQTGFGAGTVGGILTTVFNILNYVVYVLIALGMVLFVWGVIQYITAGDDEKKTAGRNHMIYAIIGLFVIVAVWGLVNVLANTLGVSPQSGGGTPLPCVNTPAPGPC